MTTKQYRGRQAIIAHMLNAINDSGAKGASRTMIMYNCFLSYAQLREYLSFLIENDLINESPQLFERSGNKKYVYKTTEKGLRFLQISREIESIVGLD